MNLLAIAPGVAQVSYVIAFTPRDSDMTGETQRFLDQAAATRQQLQETLWAAKSVAETASEDELRQMLAATEENARLSSDLNQLLLDLLTTRRLGSDSGRAQGRLAEALENPPVRSQANRMTG